MASSEGSGWILASQIFAVLTLVICYLIGIPLLIYCFRTFCAHQHKAYFMKRNTKLFWVFSSILCIYILICGPMEALSARGHLIKYTWYSPFATVMVQGIVVSALLLSNMSRFWYIFVQIRVSQERAEWKKILNPNYESWVEKYYKYISNWKYIVILNLIIPLSLLIIIVISVGFGGETGSETWAGRTLMGFIFFCGVSQFILFYLMQFVDYWYIRDEFGKYFYFLFAGIILIIIISGSGLLFSNGSIGYFNYIFITFVSNILFLLYLFYATKIIIILNENRSKKYKHKMISNNKGNAHETLTHKFKKFVSTKEGYSELMQHITREFSTETLLFLTVLTHFQNFLIEFNYLREKFELIKYDSFDIPKDIPKPPIIESQTQKLRERKEIEEKLAKQKLLKVKRGKSQSDLLHIDTIKNNVSTQKEALKQIFAFKKQSPFKKLHDHQGTPSHSFEINDQTNINKPSKLSLTTTHSIEQPVEQQPVSSVSPHTDTLSPSHENENEIEIETKQSDDNDNDNDNDDDENAMIIHKMIQIDVNHIHTQQSSNINLSINKAMEDISPLPVENEEDIFTSNIDFSALIPIYDMMYRRFIVRNSAPMEINISYACAEKLSNSHRKMMSSHRYGMQIRDWKELFLNLKDAGKQTLRLLHDSYSRFKFQTNLLQARPNNGYLEE